MATRRVVLSQSSEESQQPIPVFRLGQTIPGAKLAIFLALVAQFSPPALGDGLVPPAETQTTDSSEESIGRHRRGVDWLPETSLDGGQPGVRDPDGTLSVEPGGPPALFAAHQRKGSNLRSFLPVNLDIGFESGRSSEAPTQAVRLSVKTSEQAVSNRSAPDAVATTPNSLSISIDATNRGTNGPGRKLLRADATGAGGGPRAGP
jgi:hypothetical protein